MTIAMGAGVAIMQVTMPPTVRAWLPHRIGFATAVYTNGLLVGEILPVALMLPLVLPLAGGSWQRGFVVWSVPVVIIAVAVCCSRRACSRWSAPVRRHWWPDWRNTLIGGSASCSAPSTPHILQPMPSFRTTLQEHAGKANGSAPPFGPQRRPVAGVISIARLCRPSGAPGWPYIACGPSMCHRNRRYRVRHRRLDRGRRDTARLRRRWQS